MAEATDVAARLARGPSVALGVTKQALNEEAAMDLVAAIEWEARAQAECMQNPNFREAYEAFRAKRDAEVRVAHARHPARSAPSSSRATRRSPSGRARFAMGEIAGRAEPADDAAARKEARAMLGAARRGRLAPADLRPRSPRLLPDARGAGRGVAARGRGVRAPGPGHDADPAAADRRRRRSAGSGRSPQGKVMTAFAMTEPDAGSDVAAHRHHRAARRRSGTSSTARRP